MSEFRVIHHEPVCPDCGSHNITTSDIDTTDGLQETAHICATCGAAWPVACIAEDLRIPGERGMTGQLGVIYMLHFDQPYRHAKHYVGWTDDLLARLDHHAKGTGARLVAVIWQAGIGFTLVRICEGTRRTERAIKNAGGQVRYCPACTPHPRNGRWAAIEPCAFIPRIYPNLDFAGRR